jgi:hypothetical protein
MWPSSALYWHMGASWRVIVSCVMQETAGNYTYTQAVLESHSSDGERLEELGNGLSARLRIASCACRGALGRGEV